MNNQLFYSTFILFFTGIFIGSYIQFSYIFLFIILIACSISIYICVVTQKSLTWILLLAGFSFMCGFFRIQSIQNNSHALDNQLGNKIELLGFICDEPLQKDVTQSFCFKPDGLQDCILVTTAKYPQYFYGDEISISGTLSLPKNFETYPGGPEFDYVSYLAKDDVRYTMLRPHLIKTGEGSGSALVKTLFSIKAVFVQKMQLLFPEPESSLLGGILLGDRQSIPKDITEEFKNAGLVHILVLSGYNVTIVAVSLMKLFSFLPRVFGQSLGAISIVLFALMTGASATTVRASIMTLIVILGRSTARRYDVTRALLIAAFCMIVQNPRILAFDISFQLSFLATVALIFVSPLIKRKLVFITEKGNLREILSTTIATQIFVAPFLLYSMGQISIISFISNIFVLPFIPPAMLFGFIAIVLGFIHMYLGLPFAWGTTVVLSYILKATSFFGNIPFAVIQMRASAYALALIYLLYTIFLIFSYHSQNSSRESPN